MVRTPERYAWSSYRPMLGLTPVPPALTTDWVLEIRQNQIRRSQALCGVRACRDRPRLSLE